MDTGTRAVQLPESISEGQGEAATSASASESQRQPLAVSSAHGVLEHLDQIQDSLNSLRLACGDTRQQSGLSQAAQCLRRSHKDSEVPSVGTHGWTSSALVGIEAALVSAVDRALEDFDTKVQAVLQKRLQEFEGKLQKQWS